MSYKNLQYAAGTNKAQTLDLYVPQSDKPLPVVVWIHGGAWSSGSKDMCASLALVGMGYAAASVEYRLSQEAKFPAQINDCKAAIRFLRANAAKYNIDPNRIGVWGASAGGHLVALLGTSAGVKDLEGDGPNQEVSSEVQAVCDWFGPTDLLAMSKFPSNIKHDAADSPESRLFGRSIQEIRERVKAANPIEYVQKGKTYPPFLIMHGDRDALVPLNQSQLLHDALKKADADVEFIVVKGAGHGQFSDAASKRAVIDFFDKKLKNAPASRPTSATTSNKS